jgi:hypothetical protein
MGPEMATSEASAIWAQKISSLPFQGTKKVSILLSYFVSGFESGS